VCSDLQRIGWDLPGGFAEYLLAPSDNVHIVPDGLDPLQAVLSDPTAVAIHGLRCNLIGAPGRLAIVGAGTVGLLTALYAHDQGWAVTVVHRDGRPPVTRITPATVRATSTLTEVHTFDVVVDAASGGNSAPLDLALNLVRDGGTIIVQNAYHPDVRLQTPIRNIFRRSIRLIGSFSYCRDHHDFAEALTFLQQHPTHVHHLVVETGHLSDLPAVLTRRSVPSIRQALTVRGDSA
jgi:threonine dehydrogenase-like Zn-dependent dehydrogenase